MMSPVHDDFPSYSVDALEVLHEFYDSSVMIFVEGEDDLIFWETICIRAGIDRFKIECVGGKEQLSDKIDKIIYENAKIIVACDADHSSFIENSPEHPFIVKTYGYSIENTMYCPKSLNHFIRKMARNTTDYTESTRRWLEGFCTESFRLLVFDMANHRFSRGIQIFGDSCFRFLTSPHAVQLSKIKVDTFLDSIAIHFTQMEIKECEEAAVSCGKNLRHLIKGHFLSLGVLNWIKRHSRKKTISTDHLYTGIVDFCGHCVLANCSELKKMCDDILVAFRGVTGTNNGFQTNLFSSAL